MLITVETNNLVFDFPEIHEDAKLTVSFVRTLRIPDNDQTYNLPPGLGDFPLRKVETLNQDRIPAHWSRRGGVALPIHRAEAMWIKLSSTYPMAVKIAAGKRNAIIDEPWDLELRHGDRQNYVIVPEQLWIDGFCVKKGIIRQFIADDLDGDYTVEKQLTGKGEHGGIQIAAFPLKAEHYHPRPVRSRQFYSLGGLESVQSFSASGMMRSYAAAAPAKIDMGMAAGGMMKQEIKTSHYTDDHFDGRVLKCFAALVRAEHWLAVAGSHCPTMPPGVEEYNRAGLPWFSLYSTGNAVEGCEKLASVKSVAEIDKLKDEKMLPSNNGFEPYSVPTIKLNTKQVNQGDF